MRKNRIVVPGCETQTLKPGERTNGEGKPVANQILLRLPDEEFAAIRQELKYVHLPHYTVLHEPKEKIEFSTFLNSGLTSLVFNTDHGSSVEVGVVGNEGFTPISIAAGLRRSPHQAIMQVSGDGFRIRVDSLEAALKTNPQLQILMNRYAAVHGLQVAQTAGCNRLHDLEQRLARWLLLVQDRVGSGLLKITHDFLAMMLGTDRPSVSLAAGMLRKKKIIEYTHGSVRVLNRKKLESSACECYGLIQQFNSEMLPNSAPDAAAGGSGYESGSGIGG
ncbi:MAG TPA: Crp/Fnr family transcriptional regulator [Candidatus Eisenbacteria bacterium]|nr:Crp/Fnr family transcriptional regulator [Candidatus Eisenbacteria bacterium]